MSSTTHAKARSAGTGALAVMTLMMVGYIGAIAFTTVWLRHRISVAANASRALEVQMAEVQRKIDGVNADIARAESPAQLLAQNNALGLGLVRPGEQQIVRTADDVERRLATKRFNQLLSRNPTPHPPTAGP
ncbi:MAG: hypothetical protein IAE82_08455 [Opitutaceae bacterium]|nr:hypothetical protein [Opitutaceae bacterium]